MSSPKNQTTIYLANKKTQQDIFFFFFLEMTQPGLGDLHDIYGAEYQDQQQWRKLVPLPYDNVSEHFTPVMFFNIPFCVLHKNLAKEQSFSISFKM